MTEEQEEKYANFLDKVSEILGLNKPVDILRLCAVTDEYLRPIEKHITELEKENAKAKELIKRLMHELVVSNRPFKDVEVLVDDVEQFLNEVGK